MRLTIFRGIRLTAKIVWIFKERKTNNNQAIREEPGINFLLSAFRVIRKCNVLFSAYFHIGKQRRNEHND